MWVKYTMMRIRIDQMLVFNWIFLTPLSFVLLMVTALMHALLRGVNPWIYGIGMFLSNVISPGSQWRSPVRRGAGNGGRRRPIVDGSST